MKYRLGCVLFGHNFVGSAPWEGNDEWVKYIKSDYCIKCGLTKAECGITSTPN